MTRKPLQWLRTLVDRRRLGKIEIAAHSLHFGGSVAGCVDDWNAGRIRGWVYDASRKGEILTLDVFVDGAFAATIPANVYRDDLAAILNDGGFHGFDSEIVIPPSLCANEHVISVSLSNQPKYPIGSVVAPPSPKIDKTPAKISAADIQGDVDPLHTGIVSGWIWAERFPRLTFDVDIFCNGIFLGSKPANNYSEKIASLKKGDGKCAFVYDANRFLASLESGTNVEFRIIVSSPFGLLLGKTGGSVA